jgi:uncharacterized phiE125 gp8 family phage protein
MWYPASIETAAVAEPVSWDEAEAHLRLDGDTTEQTLVNRLIAAARAHVEAYTGTRLASQTVAVKCDSFADMARLPEAPVQSVTSIEYVNTAGTAQTLSTDVYELRAEGIEAAIVRKYNQVWPAIRPGSRITLTAVVGYATAPQDVRHAMLLLVGAWYENREQTVIGTIAANLPSALGADALLANHRRGI